MRVMITGGGTGGHTSPALAIIEELRRRDQRLAVQWVGRQGGIEERVCRANGIPFRSVPVEGWPRKRSVKQVVAVAKVAGGTAYSFFLLKRFRPQIVVSVGGYVSLPLGLAAERLGIPVVLHEQNKRLGLANRVLSANATRIFLSYPDTLGNFPKKRSRVVGNPVRAEFVMPPDRNTAHARLGLEPELPTLLVSGGSQGAETLNRAVGGALESFKERGIQLIWMTGKAYAVKARKRLEGAGVGGRVFGFIDDMAAACSAADLIVSRAGASSTAEIAVLGKPSILVPYPHATDNHQEQNARAFENAGAAVVLLDKECTGERLADVIDDLLFDHPRLDVMSEAALTMANPHAAEAIVEEMLPLVFDKAH